VLVKGKCQRREGSSRSEEILVSQMRLLPAEPKRGIRMPAEADAPAGGNGDEYGPDDIPPPDEPPPDAESYGGAPDDYSTFGGDVHIRIAGPNAAQVLQGLRKLVSSRRGETPLVLHIRENGSERVVHLAEDYRIRYDDDFRLGVRALGLPAQAIWTQAPAGAV
jgi:hypothetical protein